MARMPGAVWHPLASNWASQPRMTAHDIVCIHTMVGSLWGTDDYFRQAGYGGTESTYGTGFDGEIVQWQDTAFQADANYRGSRRIISIENADVGEGFPKWNLNDGSAVPAFTAAQIEANARIIAWECSPAAHADCPPTWLCHREGIPCELIPDSKPGRRGVGYHRLGVPGYVVPGGELWSTARGKVCPGSRRIAQIPQIIARAKQLLGGSATPNPGGFLMTLSDDRQEKLYANVQAIATYLGTQQKPGNLAQFISQIPARTVTGFKLAGLGEGDVDEKALAAELAPFLIPAVVDALKDEAGLTEEQAEAAADRALRRVFADAAGA